MYLNELDLEFIFQKSIVFTIDLCIVKNNRLLLGKRVNSPAKGFYFVPGGRVRKGETIEMGINRILYEETGKKYKMNKTHYNFLGVYEHLYKDNFKQNNKYPSQYIVLTYIINNNFIKRSERKLKCKQHSKWKWFNYDRSNTASLKIHKYTKHYIKDIRKIKKLSD